MIPSTMRGYRLAARPSLDTLAVSQLAVPQPGAGEALVRVRASSLNYHDYLVVAGLIPVAEGLMPLSDGAGEVVALGEGVVDVAVGDRVMGAFFPNWIDGRPDWSNNQAVAGETRYGFAADFVVVPASSLVPMPAGWSFEEAATLPCAGVTAWRALRVEGNVGAGDRVLVPGSGGLALFAIQLGVAMGVEIVSTSSSDAKLARLLEMGAATGVNYRDCAEWGERARELVGGDGVDVAMDIGGQSTLAQSVAACRMGGTVLVIGNISHQHPVLPLRHVIMRHVRVQGMAVGSVAMLRDLADFVAQHGIRPVIDRSFRFEELADAFRYQLSGGHMGKIVLSYD